MNQHNKANEQILKDKLKPFTEKIRNVQQRVDEAKNMMNAEITKSQDEQRKIMEEMNLMEH